MWSNQIDMATGRGIPAPGVTLPLVAETRNCERCGTLFTPAREHARFCSPRCRVAWNKQNSSEPPAESGTLDWSATAMRETTARLLQAGGWDQRHAFAMISEAVWWVTMVDATLMRYHPDIYDRVLDGYPKAERQVIEDTFGGLRYLRNQMGFDADHADFIQPLNSSSGAVPVATWTWKSVAAPPLAELSERGQEWEMTRYRSYQDQLAGRPIGQAFSLATEFLDLACGRALAPG